ncbi:MAG: proton-conducting transporter membrane subunit [Candidatus Heimdallarchaeota archaeon]
MIDPTIIVLTTFVAAVVSIIGEKDKRIGDVVAFLSAGFALFGVGLNIYSPFTGKSMLDRYGFFLTVNGFTSLLALVAALIGFLVVVYSIDYIEERVGSYNFFTLMVIGSLLGMAYCWNLLWLILFAEITTICSAPLIAHHSDAVAYEGAIKYLIIQLFAAIFALVGLGILYDQAVEGGLSPGITSLHIETLTTSGVLSGTMSEVAVLLLFIGFAAKLPTFPIHTWLGDASTVAPAPISTLLHAMMIKVAGMPAFVILFKFTYLFPNAIGLWLIVCVLGALTMFICVIMAFAQDDLKRLLAFDSVNQMGYVILGLGIGGLGVSQYNVSGDATWLGVAAGGLAAGLFHLLNHSLFKSLLFFSAGAIEHETGTRDLNKLGGLLQSMPYTGYLMLIGSLSIAGIPLLNGFNSKWMIFNASLAAERPLLAFIAIFTSALTFAVFLRVLTSVFLGNVPETYAKVRRPPKSMLAPSIVLAICCIIFGLSPQIALVNFLYPATLSLIPSGTIPSANPLVSLLQVFGGVWDPYWLFTLVLIGIIVGFLLYKLRIGIEPIVSEDKLMPFTGGVLHEPYLMIDIASPTSTVFEYPFRSVLKSVRKVHTGLVNFYVLWIVLFALILFTGLAMGLI